MALRLRIERRRPPLPRFFSSSPPEDDGKDRDPQPSSISSHFSDVKATLKRQPSGDHPLRHPTPRPSFLSRPQQQQQRITPQSLPGLQKLLSEFRSRDPPPPSGPSFQKLNLPNGSTDPSRKATLTSLEGIRESLKGISRRPNVSSVGRDGAGSSGVDRMSLSGFTDSLRLRLKEEDEAAPWKVAGGVGKEVGLPSKIFGKEIREMKEKKEGKAGKQKENLGKTKFVRSYAYEELGEKLRMLRSPADEGMKDFSLKELNERLIKLKEMEEKEMESKSKGGYFGQLRDTLWSMKLAEEEKEKANAIHRLDILGTLGMTTNFMHHPPKEHLLEKYFHPDNMSSSEKLKIQLEKVREEFKMSESDCGSARVQVAQLTTKIKHLSSVLHKKDKHSRKGLEEMVQRRKRLLKYLRKTDWDSYTMVLSRLGLRDNAELRR
ncbi:hypothetical protein MLD38_030646 [Melastoma candidum]|uniref:Uncharacterized protein n=1 Tax=Melastoma candidum TaxID=119954 RepID=A0ACB9MME0_9MYRT|nr:hypothetical protein MLD38_030646 [Melastoma candidum]